MEELFKDLPNIEKGIIKEVLLLAGEKQVIEAWKVFFQEKLQLPVMAFTRQQTPYWRANIRTIIERPVSVSNHGIIVQAMVGGREHQRPLTAFNLPPSHPYPKVLDAYLKWLERTPEFELWTVS